MSTTIEALTGGSKRERLHDAQMVTKLPAAAKALVEATAVDLGISASAVTRVALAEYFEKRGIS